MRSARTHPPGQVKSLRHPQPVNNAKFLSYPFRTQRRPSGSVADSLGTYTNVLVCNVLAHLRLFAVLKSHPLFYF